MQVKVLKHRFQVGTLHEKSIFGHLGICKLINIFSIKQDDGIFWRKGSHAWARPLQAIQLANLVAFSINQQAVVLLNNHDPRPT